MAPCQFFKSLPVNKAVKPLGGLLSFGPAFSSSALLAGVKARARANAVRNRSFFTACPPSSRIGLDVAMATMVQRAGGDCKKKAPVLMIEYALAGAALPLGSRAA